MINKKNGYYSTDAGKPLVDKLIFDDSIFNNRTLSGAV
jgi:hypothetical protein